ncbi:RNA-binding protein lark-like isoform X2 [Lineus longissimus]|uniref:RNA-binding protein lark-like isoform X2 n=1 Tax=Lineus longissimus TaxID=88925 RepID=UPI002B4DC5E0
MAMRNGYGRGGRGGGPRTRSGGVPTKVFVGQLPETMRKSDMEDLFRKFGEVVECDVVKDFGFVHYEQECDAKTAVAALNDTDFQGSMLKVEISTSKVRQRPGMGGSAVCYRCSKPGHWSKNCPQGPSRGRDDDRRGGRMGGARGRYDPYPPPSGEWLDYYREHYPPPPPYDRPGRHDPYERYRRFPMPPSPADYFRDRDPYPRPPSSYFDRRSPPSRDPYEMYMAAYERRYGAPPPPPAGRPPSPRGSGPY